MFARSIYSISPAIIQSLICDLFVWRANRVRYSGSYAQIASEMRSRGSWSSDQIAEFRDKQIELFVAYAYNSTDYYRNLFDIAGISPADVRSLADLSNVPILERGIVQSKLAEFSGRGVKRNDRHAAHTSGTTGAGLHFSATTDSIRQQWATWWRYREDHGIERGTASAYFGGQTIVPSRQKSPPFQRTVRTAKQVLYSAYHTSPKNLDWYVADLNRRRLEWIHGYPSVIALVALHSIDSQQPIEYKPRWITLGAENVTPHQIEAITTAFGTRPIQHYGMAEGVANISECPFGKLHVDEDYSGVEFIPIGKDQFKIIGTNFTNFATPLIRYDTGDVATITEGATCTCGRSGRIVDSIDGRLEDFVILKDGSKLGRMDHIFKDQIRIREAQIVQHAPGIFDINVVPGASYSEKNTQELKSEIRLRIGDRADFKVSLVDSIPRTKSGKFRFVVSGSGRNNANTP